MNDEVEALKEKVIAMRGDLAAVRAQRDALQAALDEEKRENGVLREELWEMEAYARDVFELYEKTGRSLRRAIGERSLVDGGVTYSMESDES